MDVYRLQYTVRPEFVRKYFSKSFHRVASLLKERKNIFGEYSTKNINIQLLSIPTTSTELCATKTSSETFSPYWYFKWLDLYSFITLS